MKTDIERLHKVISGELTGRGVGKTFALIHLVAGFVETGHDDIVCVITHRRDIEYLWPMFDDIFSEHEISDFKFVKHNTRIRIGDNRLIRFIVEQDLERSLIGTNALVVYMRHGD